MGSQAGAWEPECQLWTLRGAEGDVAISTRRSKPQKKPLRINPLSGFRLTFLAASYPTSEALFLLPNSAPMIIALLHHRNRRPIFTDLVFSPLPVNFYQMSTEKDQEDLFEEQWQP